MNDRPVGLRGYLVDAPSADRARGVYDGAVLWVGDQIVASGEAASVEAHPAAQQAQWLGGPHCAIVPGLLDLHAHIPQYPVVGRIEESLLPWLNRYIFPRERAFRAQEAQRLAPYFFRSLARNGTTFSILYAAIHEDSCHACFEAAESSGARAVIGKVMMDRYSYGALAPEEILPTSLQETRRLIERWHGAAQGRLEYAVSPRFAVSCSLEMMRAAGQLAREAGAWVQTHLSENLLEIQTVRGLFPGFEDYTAVYEACGLLGPKTILGHCVHLSPRERQRLLDAGAVVAHCPSSNLFLRSGIMPWDTFTQENLPFGLGSDVAGGPELSMWRVMRSALESQIARSFSQPCRIPSPTEIFYRATQGAAQAIGKGAHLGTLEVGKQADVVLLDLTELLPCPDPPRPDFDATADDLLSALIHRAGPESTLATFVAGRQLYARDP